MSSFKKKLILGLFSATAIAMTSQSASAANWLMLQGTERSGQAARAKAWGFIQAQYQKDFSDPFVTGGGAEVYIPPKLIGPNLDAQEGFNVNRARIGLRGTGMPLDSKVNYFILAEFGNNGITYGADGKILTDASITLNHIKGARIRLGLFKTPGFEEGLQAIHVFDYINFTSVGNQMMLERQPAVGDTNDAPPPNTTPNADMNRYSTAVGAFRDVGIQIFDTFGDDKHETTYAVMYGNGNGLNYADNDDNKDIYAYISSEWIYGGKKGRREGLKIFAWHQDGKRTNVYNTAQEQDRTRSGVGIKYLKKPFRVTAEYLTGEGMIFQGQHRPQHIFNNEEADGYYVDFGWYIPGSNWELDARYDSYTRGENHPTSLANDETTFDTITLGTQYHFNKKTRLNMEYSERDNESDTAAVNGQNDGVGGRFAVQVTHIF